MSAPPSPSVTASGEVAGSDFGRHGRRGRRQHERSVDAHWQGMPAVRDWRGLAGGIPRHLAGACRGLRTRQGAGSGGRPSWWRCGGCLGGSMSSRCLRLSSFTASSSPAGLRHPGPAGREGWGCKRLHGQLAEGRGSGRPASLSARSLAQCWPAGSILGMSGVSGAGASDCLPVSPCCLASRCPRTGFRCLT